MLESDGDKGYRRTGKTRRGECDQTGIEREEFDFMEDDVGGDAILRSGSG